ncbi:Hypothetical_protein [Hexamita inflata]|uniref:Hypothetical_protein n=1 Tax=Hexamita inflata TaxID=28002 RepID=A0AA86NAR7_9EUKA|nr:Hypothetical protein HINF_LOCUS3491 [Hexamita inflata]
MTQTRFLPLQINNKQMYNEYIGKQQQKGIVVDICQNQLSMEVQGEKDTFDKSYQSNDSQNLTQTVIHGADSLCSTRNLGRSSVEDFDADSGKTSSKICQDSFLNKAGYFPSRISKEYLTKPVVMLIREIVITNGVVTIGVE